jgi:phosphoglycolate phosphatase
MTLSSDPRVSETLTRKHGRCGAPPTVRTEVRLSHLIMFDFDGVIADSLKSIHDATIRALREHGLTDLASDDFVVRLVESNWFEGLRKAGVPGEVAHLIDELTAVSVAAGEVAPYEGIGEVIDALAERHHVVIVTSNRSDIVADFLSQWDITGIDEVLGGDKGESKVPKLKAVLSRYPHDRAWFIGDTVGDIVEGMAAGVATVAVTWGWHSERQLLESSPERVAHSPLDLLRLLL